MSTATHPLDEYDPRHSPPVRRDRNGHSLLNARRMRELREATGLSQEQAAVYAGCGRNTLQRIESGVASPRLDTLRRILDLYGEQLGRFLSIADLIDG